MSAWLATSTYTQGAHIPATRVPAQQEAALNIARAMEPAAAEAGTAAEEGEREPIARSALLRRAPREGLRVIPMPDVLCSRSAPVFRQQVDAAGPPGNR